MGNGNGDTMQTNFAKVMYVIERIGIAGAIAGYLVWQLPGMLKVVEQNTVAANKNAEVQQSVVEALDRVSDEIGAHRNATERMSRPRRSEREEEE